MEFIPIIHSIEINVLYFLPLLLELTQKLHNTIHGTILFKNGAAVNRGRQLFYMKHFSAAVNRRGRRYLEVLQYVSYFPVSERRIQAFTFMVASADFLKVPSIPLGPNPSIISRVSLNGTVSGVGKILPCSKAIPKSAI